MIKKVSRILCFATFLFTTNSNCLEITPMLGFRAGGEFTDTTSNSRHTIESSNSYSLIIGLPYELKKDIEVFYSHHKSSLHSVDIASPSINTIVDLPVTITYLHLGGTAPISNTAYDNGKLKTFISGGLGFTYLKPNFTGLQSDLRASFSIGTGLKWAITQRIGLRLEVRGMATLFNSNTAIFCNGGCSLTINGSLLTQAEVLAGMAIKF